MREDRRVAIPSGFVEAVIDRAAKRFPLHGRDPTRTIEVGGEAVHFGTGGAAVHDAGSGQRRLPAFDIAGPAMTSPGCRTADQCQLVHRCCVATDVPAILDLDVNTAYALSAGTHQTRGDIVHAGRKRGAGCRHVRHRRGARGAFSERPWIKAHISPVISPLRYGEDAVDVTFACIDANIPLSCITAAQSGATAPATLAGFLVAEPGRDAGEPCMVHVIRPGHPMVFSNWPLVIDLRTGAFAGGGGEIAVLNAASAQITNWLGLPSGVAASMTDAKAIDAQYGAEKGVTALAAALAGGNLIYESSGMTAALLGVSFEAFLLDDDMHASIYRMLRGIEVTEDTIGLEAITAAVMGEGHFLGAAETLASMERDYVYPSLADRDQPIAWSEGGRLTAWQRANARAREILAEPGPVYISSAADAEIRGRFNILLQDQN